MGLHRAFVIGPATVVLCTAACVHVTDRVAGTESLIVSVSDSVPAADGATLVQVMITLNKDPSDPRGIVSLNTTAGSFADSGHAQPSSITLIADTSGSALALLRAPHDTGVAILTALSNGEARRTTVHFVEAFPESIEIELPRSAVPDTLGGPVTIIASLIRAYGTPSTGREVVFSANTQSDTGPPAGQFGIVPRSDSLGRLMVNYFPGPAAPETVFVVAKTLKATGDSVAAQARLILTP